MLPLTFCPDTLELYGFKYWVVDREKCKILWSESYKVRARFGTFEDMVFAAQDRADYANGEKA